MHSQALTLSALSAMPLASALWFNLSVPDDLMSADEFRRRFNLPYPHLVAFVPCSSLRTGKECPRRHFYPRLIVAQD